jgi:hypothetical protein
MFGVLRRTALAGAVVAALVTAPAALADGTETLGTPSIPIANGTDVRVAGVGTQEHPGTPVSFSVNVPAGALVNQVLVYWEGHVTAPANTADDTISLNGTPVTGTLIGGPTIFFRTEAFSTYRADVTALGLVTPGANTITVSDMNFLSTFEPPSGNDGVGLVVIYDDGTPSTVAGIKDGQDLAFARFDPPLDRTVPQTFNFASSGEERTASLGVLAGSVEGPDLGGVRGNVISGQFDTGQTFSIVNGLGSNQGFEFDAQNFPVTVPAGATSLTVELVSEGGDLPASMTWIAGTLSVDEPPPPPPGGQGCTPGYWKNHLDAWGPTSYSPGQALSSVFSGAGSLGSASLLDALKFKGGSTLDAKKQILLRAAVASLLNAAHPDVAFGSTPAQVISAVNAALASNDADAILALATSLDDANNAGCTLN